MTDESSAATPKHEGHQPDWFLCQMVEWANRFGVELGVTLNVKGQVISGTLISGTRYFNALAEVFRGDSEEDSIAGQLAKMVQLHAGIYEPYDLALLGPQNSASDVGDTGDGAIDLPPEPTFIHLRDARVFAPGQSPLPSNGGVLWRGRLGQIDGFSIGQLRSD